MRSWYGPYIVSDICAKVEQVMKIAIEILLAIRKAKWEVLKDLPDFLLKLNLDQVET